MSLTKEKYFEFLKSRAQPEEKEEIYSSREGEDEEKETKPKKKGVKKNESNSVKKSRRVATVELEEEEPEKNGERDEIRPPIYLHNYNFPSQVFF